MKKYITIFLIAILTLTISINKVSAKMPDIPTEYGDYYTIIHTNNPDYNYANDSYLTIKHDYVIYFNSISKIYVGNYNQSDYTTEYNPLGITELKSFKNGTSSPKFKAILYANDNDSSWTLYNENSSFWGECLYSQYNPEIYYTSVDIWSGGETTKFYEAGYMSDSYKKDSRSIKFEDHGLVCDKENVENEYISIDYTDYFNKSFKYQYKVGNSDWIDITSSFTSLNGYCSVDEDCDLKYDIFVYYNTKIQARVLDSNNDVISAADYDVNNENLMPYMPPKYNPKIKYINNQLKFNLEWYEWLEESSNAQIFLHVIDPDINYTYNYSKYLNSNTEPDFLVNKESIVELEFGAIINDELKIYKKETINIIDLLNLEENSTVKEEFEINNNYNDMKSILDQLKSLLNMFKNFFDGFYEICSYLYSKLNKWIKGTIIIILINKLIYAVVKMIRR